MKWRWGGASESQSGLGNKTDTCDGFYRDDVTWLEMGRVVKYESSDSISNSLGHDGLILGTGKNAGGVMFVEKKLGTDCAKAGIHRKVSGR